MVANNLANNITVTRILFIPLIIIISVVTKVQAPFYNHICLIIIILFGIGDVIDGYIARKYDQMTTLGAFLDPFADKYMVISCYMVLAYFNKIPLWYLLLVFNKEIIVFTAFVMLFLRTNDIYIKPNIFCKASTVIQVIIIFMSYLNINHKLLLYIIIASSVIMLTAGVSYIVAGLRFGNRVKLGEDI